MPPRRVVERLELAHPERRVRRMELGVEPREPADAGRAAAAERSADGERSVSGEDPRGAAAERLDALRRRDVQDVHAQDGVRRPALPQVDAQVVVERRAQVGERGLARPRGDAGACLRIGIGRLEDERGERAREMDGVLVRAASELEDPPRLRQDPGERGGERGAVAKGGGARSLHVPYR